MDHPDDVALLVYHVPWYPGDPWVNLNNGDHSGRTDYYPLVGVPTLMVDGLLDRWPITPDLLHQSVQNRLAIPSPIAIDVSANVGTDEVTATITIESADEDVTGNHVLRVGLVNKEYDGWTGSNGQSVWHYDMLDMAPDHQGQAFSIGTNETATYDVSFDWPVVLNNDTIADDNIAVIAFVQNDDTREVIQSGLADPSDVPTVTLELVPQNTNIPAGGGTVTYDIDLMSEFPNAFTGVYYWTTVTTPGGFTTQPLSMVPFTLQAYMDVYVAGASQAVPAGAPTGMYTFTGNVGFPGTDMVVSSEFWFFKLGSGTDGFRFDPAQWPGSVDFAAASAGEDDSAQPSGFALHPAHPNPFNGQTTVSVTLPRDGDLRVTVHNLAGRQVATLAGGSYSAGTHRLTLTADGLSAGMYFVRATSPAGSATQKVLLLK